MLTYPADLPPPVPLPRSATETLDRDDKFFCDTCCCLQEAQKRMKLKQLPQCLCLHLKRFKYIESLARCGWQVAAARHTLHGAVAAHTLWLGTQMPEGLTLVIWAWPNEYALCPDCQPMIWH